jgi:hypothetical protein
VGNQGMNDDKRVYQDLGNYFLFADHSLRNSSLTSHNGDRRILTLIAARTYNIGHILSL